MVICDEMINLMLDVDRSMRLFPKAAWETLTNTRRVFAILPRNLELLGNPEGFLIKQGNATALLS